MKATSPNTIQYNGKRWSLIVDVMIDDMDQKDPNQFFALDNTNIKQIRYSNAFNQLCLVGDIEYHDAYGQIDKLLDRQFAYCRIRMIQHLEGSDGKITLEKFDLGTKFVHTFLINSVKIKNRQGDQVDYVLGLVSANWFNCYQNLIFTNYDKQPESIFDILGSCIVRSGLDIDQDTFNKVTTNVKLNYITCENDNLFTVADYLLSKLYYYKTKDDSLKTLIFNETSEKFQLYDYKDSMESNGSYQILMSMFKSQNEGLLEEEQNQLATVVEFPASSYIQNVSNYKMKDYDLSKNTFTNCDFSNEQIALYLNNKDSTNTYDIRNKLPFKDFNSFYSGTYWNNSTDIYRKAIEQQLKMNSLILNTSAEILRKPGSLVTVVLDRTMLQQSSENHQSLEDLKKKFLGFEGLWIVSKVVNIIEPKSSRYRQNLTLSRNYMLSKPKSSR